MTEPSRPTLLMVDDEETMLDFGERVFGADFEVLRARTAAEALALLRSRAIDVLLTDHSMPEMSGVDLLRAAATEFPQVVRVLMTGYCDGLEANPPPATGRTCPAHAQVYKPLDAAGLRDAVRAAFRVAGIAL